MYFRAFHLGDPLSHRSFACLGLRLQLILRLNWDDMGRFSYRRQSINKRRNVLIGLKLRFRRLILHLSQHFLRNQGFLPESCKLLKQLNLKRVQQCYLLSGHLLLEISLQHVCSGTHEKVKSPFNIVDANITHSWAVIVTLLSCCSPYSNGNIWLAWFSSIVRCRSCTWRSCCSI